MRYFVSPGSGPAIGLGRCSSVWSEQEHRKVHFTYCFYPFTLNNNIKKMP